MGLEVKQQQQGLKGVSVSERVHGQAAREGPGGNWTLWYTPTVPAHAAEVSNQDQCSKHLRPSSRPDNSRSPVADIGYRRENDRQAKVRKC